MGITKQRQEIYAILSSYNRHMTADQVYDAVRHTFPHIGRGTVYRNLNLMADAGKIRRLYIPGQPVHFDPNTYRHQHMVCVKCGKVWDIKDISPEEINKMAGARITVVDQITIVYVVCDECAALALNKT